MVERTFFLALLFTLFGSPLAMAEEIGGGSPDEPPPSSAESAGPSESVESESGDCLTEKLLDFFFGDI